MGVYLLPCVIFREAIIFTIKKRHCHTQHHTTFYNFFRKQNYYADFRRIPGNKHTLQYKF